MFQQARIKLTGWYLLILTIIVVVFSMTIYRLVNIELGRIANSQRNRIERWQILAPPRVDMPPIILFDESEVTDLRRRLIIMLVVADCVIIFLSGFLSYLLAGKTLSPIEDTMHKQEQFVSDSSHELRTPLTALRTGMEVAIRDKEMTTSVARQVITDNLREVIRLQTLAESLLELTRAKSGLPVSPTKSLIVIAQAFKEIEVMAKTKDIKVVLPKKNIEIMAHPQALTRVIVIALDNAIKYSASETTIKVKTVTEKKMGHIIVSDQGQGIEQDQLNKVFERFFRGDIARSSTTPGYGLGLALAKQLIDAQNGEISINSIVDGGTTVTISLPLI